MRQVVAKFFADRGTHLAAMIAYFALLSFVPLLFLSLALLGLVHQADQSSFFVRELERTFPSTSIDSILRAVRAIQSNAAALGAVGGAFLLWSSLSFFSVLESAFNIVYGRPNRGWLHGKALATMMMSGSLVALFLSLVVGSVGQEILKRYFGFAGNAFSARAVAIAVSTLGLFVFLTSAYWVLTNANLTVREVLPGAVTAAVILEASFQALPVYVDVSKHNPVLQTLSGPAILLVWLYVMANVIVLGAEVNWWRAPGVTVDDVRAIVADLPRAYEAFVRGRVKFRVGRIVFVALSKDGETMGFGFPKAWRQAQVDAEPEKFSLPSEHDMQYHWLHVNLAKIDADELRDLVEGAWSMCAPKRVVAEYRRSRERVQ